MSIQLKKNDAPIMPVCEMICDGGLSEKLNKYELTKFLNKHSVNLFCGSAGSGKTSLLYSFFKSGKLLKKVYENIYVFQPINSGDSMSDPLFKRIPEDQQYSELTPDNLTEVMDKINNEDPSYNNCIIIDDMTAYLKNYENEKILKNIVFNRRHMRTSIFMLVQSYVSVPLQIRKLFSNLFIFKVNKREFNTIMEENIEKKKELHDEIRNIIFDKPHSYMFLNTDSGRIFKKFDELIFS
jgi:hypothetical protein